MVISPRRPDLEHVGALVRLGEENVFGMRPETTQSIEDANTDQWARASNSPLLRATTVTDQNLVLVPRRIVPPEIALRGFMTIRRFLAHRARHVCSDASTPS